MTTTTTCNAANGGASSYPPRGFGLVSELARVVVTAATRREKHYLHIQRAHDVREIHRMPAARRCKQCAHRPPEGS
jgi:hypothetical protein